MSRKARERARPPLAEISPEEAEQALQEWSALEKQDHIEMLAAIRRKPKPLTEEPYASTELD